LISDAQNLLDGAVVGTDPGEYPQSAVDDLGDAITAAQTVADDEDASQAAVDAAVSALALAITDFEESVIE
jgi:hypothetical protein